MLIPAPTVLIVSDRPGAGHQPSLVQAFVVSCLDYASHHLVSSLPALTYKNNGLSSFVWRVRGAASPLVPPLLFTWCWMPPPNRVLSLPRSSSFHMLFPLPEPHTPHPPLCPTFTTALGVLSGEVSLAAQGALGTSSTLCADS